MTAPNVAESEPSLVEAFSEFSEAIANAEEQGGDISGHPQQPAQQTAEDAELAQQSAPPPAGQVPGAEQSGDQRDQRSTQAQGQPATQSSAQLAAEAADAEPTEQPEVPEAQPLIYNVNGEQRAFEGGFYVPGQGLIFTEEARGRVLDVLQRSDRLSAQNQQLYQQSQEYQKFGGRAAFEKLQSEKAGLDVGTTILLRALADQNTLVQLATDPIARHQLLKEIDLAAREAQFKAVQSAREGVARETAQMSMAQQTQTAIWNAVGQLAPEFQGLTADDVQSVRSYAGRMHPAIVRAATPAEAQEANVQPGMPIIDIPLLREMLKDRHALRQSAVEAARQRQTVASENAARAAAAAPTRVVTNGKVPPPRPGPGQPSSEKKPLDQMSYTELTRAMRSGRIMNILDEEDAQNQ